MNNRIFYNWVPQKLDLPLLLFLASMLSLNAGIPTSITNYIVGSQASIPADLNMASFAYYTGLAAVVPLSSRLQRYSSRKQLLCLIFPALIGLNFIYSVTDQPLVMVMVSFTIGFIKMVATLIVVIALMPVLMPKGERYQLYCMYYPLSLIFSPVAGFIAASIAENWNWKISFYTQNLFLCTGLLIVIFLIHPNRHTKKTPLYQYDWIGTIFYTIGLLLVSYFFAYRLTLDGFQSIQIQAAAIGAVLSLVFFIRRSLTVKRPFIDFGFFKYWKPMLGVTMLFVLGMFYNTSSLISPFLNIILRNNPVRSAEVNLYVIPGYFSGALLCFLYYRKYTKFNVMAAMACICYLVSNLMMYRLTSTSTGASDLFLPMFFRAMATVISYISAGLYITRNIPASLIVDITAVIIIVRSLLPPVIANALYGNWLYQGSIRHLNLLANNMDMLNTPASSRAAALLGNVRIQASLLAIRDIYGILIVSGIILLAFVIVFPFHGSDKRVVFNWKDPSNTEEIAQSIAV